PDGGEPGLPGTVTARDKRILVFCGHGALSIEEAQLEGKRAMPLVDLARGQRGLVGATLG
ncbi:MAG: hypothetical protein K1X39_09805, partial [Thermoflexales bacterium]|nr:hypothetical protein [Thermoflexales bacterium]